METFLEPQNALKSNLLWIVRSGPNRGQALPLLPGVFGRLNGFDDCGISRENLYILQRGKSLLARPLPGKKPVYRMWKNLGLRWKMRRTTRLKPGRMLRLGKTQLQIQARPADLRLSPPPEPKPTSQRWVLFMIIPLASTLALGAFIGWRSLLVFFILAIALASWLFHTARSIPRPEQLWLAAATPLRTPHQKTKGLHVFTGNFWRKRLLSLPAGENLCLTGPGATGYAYWLVAQALIFGQGYLSPENPSVWRGIKNRNDQDKLEIRLISPQDNPNCQENQVAIVIANIPPAWAHRSVYVKSKRGFLSAAWFSSLKQAWEQNPTFVELAKPVPGASLPKQVTRELLGESTAEDIASNWATEKKGLETVLGLQENGKPWRLDLVTEGPHALVAGTTGAGKSELLTSWLLGLAFHYSPSDLRFILIDYKGGAAFGELARLPHVHGILTDLHPRLTSRALESLEAFLKQRESILATVRARDVNHYYALTGERLARVMIVVDEFRALATDHAEVMENLIRLATHGRSLGLHLILATQKPGGIVNGQILANTNLRIALRVRTGADSNDILGDSRAAELPAIPGRLYWEANSSGLAQAIWCGADDWVEQKVSAVRKACAVFYPPAPTAKTVHESTQSLGLVSESDSLPSLPRIWLPELPSSVEPPPGKFALLDCPRSAKQEWRCPRSLFGIFGNPGSGRSMALRTLAVNEADISDSSYLVVVSPTKDVFADLALRFAGRLVIISPQELWRVQRLCQCLERDELGRALVLLDRADLLAEALESVHPGQGGKILERILGGAGRNNYRVAFTAPLNAGRSSWGSLAAQRFVLMPRDLIDLHSAGIEASGLQVSLSKLLPSQMCPGRGVWQLDGACFEAQIGLSASVELESGWLGEKTQFYDSFTHSGLLDSLLPFLPQRLQVGDIPSSSRYVTLGWDSERGDWAKFSPQRWWQVEDSSVMRGLVSQIKREYRRLGYRTVDLESFGDKHKNGKILLVISNFEQNSARLKEIWESKEKHTDFDITIMELVSSGLFPHNLAVPGDFFTYPQTRILALSKTVESRHQLASALQISPEKVRKLQVTTGYTAIFKDEKRVSALLPPLAKVKHLT